MTRQQKECRYYLLMAPPLNVLSADANLGLGHQRAIQAEF